MPSIDLSDREYIQLALQNGQSYRAIAEMLGVHGNTVSTFVKRNLPELRRPERGVYEKPPPKLLVLDIETMANLAWTWGVWQQDIAPVQIVKHKRTLSFAAKWVGESKIYFASEHHTGRVAMVTMAFDLVNQAEGIIGYNSKRFDIKHLNTEFELAGLGPPQAFQHIDLFTITKREFAFGSNKLESVADRLGLGKKREHEGFALWLKCEAGDKDAWDRMRSYNIQDVRLTEQLFERYRPWIPLRGRQSQKQLRKLVTE